MPASLKPEITDALATWNASDGARAVHPADRAAIAATEPARALVLDLLRRDPSRDLYNACARLGVLLAEHGASPTLAAGTIDTAADALGTTATAAARAALVEGYVARLRDDAHEASLRAWDAPACVVPLDGEPKTVAVACFVPTDDPEALAEWAARTATRLSKDRVKNVVLAGRIPVVTELKSALGLVGIAIGPPKPAFRWPWK